MAVSPAPGAAARALVELGCGVFFVSGLAWASIGSAAPWYVLAAVVLVAVSGLFKIETLVELWRGDRPEFFVAMATLLGVLGSGLLRGVMIGAGAKILGNIEVGHCARIAAGSVVIKPVPNNVTVAGVPAKVVGEAGCPEPSRAMDQMLYGIMLDG